jgi:hypothetical protein
MKIVSLLAAGLFCVFGQTAIAKPLKTKAWDVVGTTFIVSVDWDTNVVSAKLRSNPARLSGQALEQSMQKAVYYGSAVNCRMRATGRKSIGPNEIVGVLHCPWFDKAPRSSM